MVKRRAAQDNHVKGAFFNRQCLGQEGNDDNDLPHRSPRRGARVGHLSFSATASQSASRLESWLAADQTSPSQGAIASEQAVGLAHGLARLPEAQWRAVTPHHFEGWTLEQIGEHLGRSPAAVAGLIKQA